jgi:sugar phosphate isomerase/epimerase
MKSFSRREFLAAAAAVPTLARAQSSATAQTPAGSIFVCIHGASVQNFDYKAQMEGIAKAGVRAVEPELTKVRTFTQIAGESPATAKRVLTDLGLRAVSSSNHLGLPDAANPAQLLEDLKWKVELAQAIGCDRIVCPSTSSGTQAKTADDYKRGADNMRAGGEIAKPFGVTLMLEFARTSTLAGSLPSALKIVREANHPNVRVMIDTYHFWGGISKFEDLELLRDGELAHLHFEDVPADPPRETQGQPHRVFPGEGVAPLRRIIAVLKQKKYSGPASLEMFQSQSALVRELDPYAVATRARKAIEPLIA